MNKAGAVLLITVFAASAQSQEEQDSAVTATAIIRRMAQMNEARATALERYSVTRRYILDNIRFHKHAEMTVRMTYTAPGKKSFEVISEDGPGWIRNHVLRKLMQAEIEGAHRDAQTTPNNYNFQLLGTETLDGRPSYLLEATPKTKNKYLFRGRVWVDCEDAAVARIEGSPAQNPSFWTTKVHFVHRYEKHGPYWLAGSNVSETEVRVFGPTNLKIEYFDYAMNPPPSREAVGERPAVSR